MRRAVPVVLFVVPGTLGLAAESKPTPRKSYFRLGSAADARVRARGPY